jgi:hypothetical protein
MFAATNFLKMIRIGIIGSDKRLLTIIDLIKTLEDIEITGCCCENYNYTEESSTYTGILFYPTCEALFRYVDAVVINFDVAGNVPLIIKCLKNFKHVLSMDTQGIRHKDFEYLEKIAEESNVKFYPEFGEPIFKISEKLYSSLSGFHYMNIHHSIGCWPIVTGEEKIFSALLQNLSLLMNLTGANIKKISANGWNFCDPGSGMLNVKLDFDNGSITNMLIVNAIVLKQFHVVCYNASSKTDISIEKDIGHASILPLTEGMPENISITIPPNEAILQRLTLFISAIRQNSHGLKAIENQFKALRVNYIIHEKINNFSSKNILYS